MKKVEGFGPLALAPQGAPAAQVLSRRTSRCPSRLIALKNRGIQEYTAPSRHVSVLLCRQSLFQLLIYVLWGQSSNSGTGKSFVAVNPVGSILENLQSGVHFTGLTTAICRRTDNQDDFSSTTLPASIPENACRTLCQWPRACHKGTQPGEANQQADPVQRRGHAGDRPRQFTYLQCRR